MKKSLLFSLFALVSTFLLAGNHSANAQSPHDLNYYSHQDFYCQGHFFFQNRLNSTEYSHPDLRVLQKRTENQIEITIALDDQKENIHLTHGGNTTTLTPDLMENARLLEEESETRYRFKKAIGTQVLETKIKRLVPSPDGQSFYVVVEETIKTYPRNRDDLTIPFVDNGFGGSLQNMLSGTVNGVVGLVTGGLPSATEPLTVEKLRYSVVKYSNDGTLIDQLSIDEVYDPSEFASGIATINAYRLFDEAPIYINGDSIFLRPERNELNPNEAPFPSNDISFTNDVFRVDSNSSGQFPAMGALSVAQLREQISVSSSEQIQLFRVDARKILTDIAPVQNGNVLAYTSNYIGEYNPSEVVFQETLGNYTYMNGTLLDSPEGKVYMDKPFLWQSPTDLDEALVWGQGRFSEVAPLHHAKVVRVAPDGDLLFIFPFSNRDLVLSYAVLKVRPGRTYVQDESTGQLREQGGIVKAWEVVGRSDDDNDELIGAYVIGNTLYLHGDTGFGQSADDFNLEMTPTVVRIEL